MLQGLPLSNFSKKKRLESSSFPNSAQLSIDNDKLSTADTSDDEAESGTWFWNESAHETDSDSDSEEAGNIDIDDADLEEEQSRTEQAVSPKLCKTEVKWNREGEQNFRGGYRKGSRSTQMRRNRSFRELEMEDSKTYNFQALWQRSQDLGMV